jgi:hypothetical protein
VALREYFGYDVLARPSCGAEEEEMHDLGGWEVPFSSGLLEEVELVAR